MNFEDKIKELNIKFPEAKAPVGNYFAKKIEPTQSKRTKNFSYVFRILLEKKSKICS